MKGIVLEIKKGYAAVLTDDGSVVKVRRKCAVGDTIVIRASEVSGSGNVRIVRFVRFTAIAAAVLLVILGGGYYYTATAAAAVVTLHAADGDITLSLNSLNRVVRVEAAGNVREDAVETLYSAGIRNSLLPDALEKANIVLKENNEIEETAFSVDVASQDQERADTLRTQAMDRGFSIGAWPGAEGGLPGADENNGSLPESIVQDGPDGQAGPQAGPAPAPAGEDGLPSTPDDPMGAQTGGAPGQPEDGMSSAPDGQLQPDAMPGQLDEKDQQAEAESQMQAPAGENPGQLNEPDQQPGTESQIQPPAGEMSGQPQDQNLQAAAEGALQVQEMPAPAEESGGIFGPGSQLEP